MKSSDQQEHRRSFSRVEIYAPADFRLVPDSEREFVRSRLTGELLFADYHRAPPPENHPKAAWIAPLNKKIDAILQMLTLQSEGFHTLPFKYVTLSGSGMAFSSQQPFSPGDWIELKILLTQEKPMAFLLYGEVVKVQRQTSGHFIAVAFQRIDHAVQDRLVRFVFEAERKMLRERREAGQTAG